MGKEETQKANSCVPLDDIGSTSTTFSYYRSSREVACSYATKCSDYNKCCDSCRHNTAKRSYYEPEDCPYSPYEPYYPQPPYFPYPYYPITITYDGTTTTASDTAWDDLYTHTAVRYVSS